MVPLNTITLSAKLVEILDSGTTTIKFVVVHDHAWTGPDGAMHSGSFRVRCVAWGHARNALLKYGKLGLDVVLHGRLGATDGDMEIIVDSLSFISPRQVFEQRPQQALQGTTGPTHPGRRPGT